MTVEIVLFVLNIWQWSNYNRISANQVRNCHGYFGFPGKWSNTTEKNSRRHYIEHSMNLLYKYPMNSQQTFLSFHMHMCKWVGLLHCGTPTRHCWCRSRTEHRLLVTEHRLNWLLSLATLRCPRTYSEFYFDTHRITRLQRFEHLAGITFNLFHIRGPEEFHWDLCHI